MSRVVSFRMVGWGGLETWKSSLPMKLQAWNVAVKLMRGPYADWNVEPDRLLIEMPGGVFRVQITESRPCLEVASLVDRVWQRMPASAVRDLIQTVGVSLVVRAVPAAADPATVESRGHLGLV